ncbi:YoaK family protein [Acinetobacter baumannii]|nr:YoaK family protein [Acinetobacter baumannii]
MFTTLPKKILLLLFIFALNAGLLNSLTLITFFHQPVTHMTGNVSLLATDLYFASYSHLIFLIFVIIAFMMGTILSGFILGTSDFKLEANYGYLLSVELTCVICCLISAMLDLSSLVIIFATLSAGIQNSLLSSYKGINIRTTHLTGVFTDLGLAIGLKLRRINVPIQRFTLNLAILAGFITGCLLSIPLLKYLSHLAFIGPTILILFLCSSYWFKFFSHSTDQTNK